jgi:hypothetical protein
MSGSLRWFAACLVLAGLSTTPAFSNPFAALFGAPEEATAPAAAPAPAPAPAKDDCLQQPGKSTAEGQHWVYRYDGHRKCWFQAAEEVIRVRRAAHRHATKQRVAAPEENEAAPLRKQKAVVDARAELLRSSPAETAQPTAAPLEPELKVVDAAPFPATGAAALVPPPPPVVSQSATDQLAADQPMANDPSPPQVDVETLLAAAPQSGEVAAASVAPTTTPVTVPIAETSNGWTATGLGVLLMALGLVSLLGSSRTLRRALLIGRPLDPTINVAPSRHRLSAWAEADQ